MYQQVNNEANAFSGRVYQCCTYRSTEDLRGAHIVSAKGDPRHHIFNGGYAWIHRVVHAGIVLNSTYTRDSNTCDDGR